jgi:type II secretory pathway pseudopilin PulG
MKHTDNQARGFSLLELMVSCAVLFVVVGGAVNYIALVTQRSKSEQTKVDLTQEGREFVDEFERDIHQAGYPGCTMFNTIGFANCVANYGNTSVAAGLVYASNTRIIFEGDVDGDGVVESIQYEVVDSAGAWPPAGNCPCTIRRSQVPKTAVWPVAPLGQPTSWSQEVQNVVNSGTPAGGAAYGNGLAISGNVLFGGGAITNDAYYAAVTTFKDYPVFSAYDQNGAIIPINPAIDNSTAAGQTILTGNSATGIKSIRITLNLLGSATAGYDLKSGVRPVVTLVGDGRRNNY